MSQRQLNFICTCLCLFFSTCLSAQLVPEKLPVLIINEVHNEDYLNDDVFIELVVVKTNDIAHNPNDNGPKIIIDDTNNGPGIQPGFIAINPSSISDVKEGELIVIHGRNTDISSAPSNARLMSFDSSAIEKYSGVPTSQNSSYQGAVPSDLISPNFSDFISFTGHGDKIQVRINEVFFNKVDLTTDKNYSLDEDNFNHRGPLPPTLGGGNNASNTSLLNGLTSNGRFEIKCSESAGVIQIEILNGTTPFILETEDYTQTSIFSTSISALGLDCGNQVLTVTDKNGKKSSCKVDVNYEDFVEIRGCGNSPIDLSEYICLQSESDCVQLVLGTNMKTVNLNEPILVDVPFPEPTMLLFSNGEGEISRRVEFILDHNSPGEACNDKNPCTHNDMLDDDCNCVGEVDNLGLEIFANRESECENSITTLRTNQNYDSYRWIVGNSILSTDKEFSTGYTGLVTVEVDAAAGCIISSTYFIHDFEENTIEIKSTSETICEGSSIELSIDNSYAGQTITWKDEFDNQIATGVNSIVVYSEGLYKVEIGESDCTLSGEYNVKSSSGRDWKINPRNNILCSQPITLSIDPLPFSSEYSSIAWRKWNPVILEWEEMNMERQNTSIEVDETGKYSVEIITPQECVITDEVKVTDGNDFESIDELLKSKGFFLSEWESQDLVTAIPSAPKRNIGCSLNETNVSEDVLLIPLGSSAPETTLQNWYNENVISTCHQRCSDQHAGYISLYQCNGSFDMNEFFDLGSSNEYGVTKSLIVEDGGIMKIYTKFPRTPDPRCVNPYARNRKLVKNLIKDIICAIKEGESTLTLSYTEDKGDRSFVSPMYEPGELYGKWNPNKSFGQVAITDFRTGLEIEIPESIAAITRDRTPTLCENDKFVQFNLLAPLTGGIAYPGNGYQQLPYIESAVEYIFPYDGFNGCYLSIILDKHEQVAFESMLGGNEISTDLENIYSKSEDIPLCLLPDLDLCNLITYFSNYSGPGSSERSALTNLLSASDKTTANEVMDCIYNTESDPQNLLIDDIYKNYGFDTGIFPALASLYYTLEKSKGIETATGLNLKIMPDSDTEYELNGPSISSLNFIEAGIGGGRSSFYDHYSNSFFTELIINPFVGGLDPFGCGLISFRNTNTFPEIRHFDDYWVKINNDGLQLPEKLGLRQKSFAPVPGLLLPYLASENVDDINTTYLVNLGLRASFVISASEVLAARAAGGLNSLRGYFALGDLAGTFSELMLSDEDICNGIDPDFCKDLKKVIGVFTLASATGTIYVSVADFRTMQQLRTKYNSNPEIEETLVANVPDPHKVIVREGLQQALGSVPDLSALLKSRYTRLTDDTKVDQLIEKLRTSKCDLKENQAVILLDDKISDVINHSSKRADAFFDDLIANANVAGTIGFDLVKLDEYVVKAWETLFDLPNLRINTTKLKAVDDFVTAKNIDHSLIKTELDNLPTGYKEDLINSFEVANGSTPYPVLKNNLPVSTDGDLYGTFTNGQFVPTTNAPSGGTWDFVVMTSGEVKVGSKHSWLADGGQDVLAAGEVKINGGIIEEITNASGHYTPSPGEGMNYLRILKEQGIDVSSAHLYLERWSPVSGFVPVRDVSPVASYRSLYD